MNVLSFERLGPLSVSLEDVAENSAGSTWLVSQSKTDGGHFWAVCGQVKLPYCGRRNCYVRAQVDRFEEHPPQVVRLREEVRVKSYLL